MFAFKELIKKNLSKKHAIIFGANQLDPKSGNFYNSMLLVDNDFKIIQKTFITFKYFEFIFVYYMYLFHEIALLSVTCGLSP